MIEKPNLRVQGFGGFREESVAEAQGASPRFLLLSPDELTINSEAGENTPLDENEIMEWRNLT